MMHIILGLTRSPLVFPPHLSVGPKILPALVERPLMESQWCFSAEHKLTRTPLMRWVLAVLLFARHPVLEKRKLMLHFHVHAVGSVSPVHRLSLVLSLVDALMPMPLAESHL